MTKRINPTDVSIPLVSEQGKPHQHFYELLDNISKLEVLDGEGSPEGAISAQQKRFYLDTSGNVLYIKSTDGGNTGWVALN